MIVIRKDKKVKAMINFECGDNLPGKFKEVFNVLPPDIINKLSGEDLGRVMTAIYKSACTGRPSWGADFNKRYPQEKPIITVVPGGHRGPGFFKYLKKLDELANGK